MDTVLTLHYLCRRCPLPSEVVKKCQVWHHFKKTCIGQFPRPFRSRGESLHVVLLPTFELFLSKRIEAGGDSQDFALICPKRFNSRNGESPAGGDNVRRLTFGKTAIVYEAEAPCFSLWVLSPSTIPVSSMLC